MADGKHKIIVTIWDYWQVENTLYVLLDIGGKLKLTERGIDETIRYL